MSKALVVMKHCVVAQALQNRLEPQIFDSVMIAHDGEQALNLVQETDIDLVIMDLALEKKTGVDLIVAVHHAKPDVKLVVLTDSTSPLVLREILSLKVDGVISKHLNADLLDYALQKVMAGTQFIDEFFAPYISQGEHSEGLGRRTSRKRLCSRRERQVVKLVSEGCRSSDIAQILGLQDRTITKHREQIMNKLGAYSPADLVRYAREIGLHATRLEDLQ